MQQRTEDGVTFQSNEQLYFESRILHQGIRRGGPAKGSRGRAHELTNIGGCASDRERVARAVQRTKPKLLARTLMTRRT
jgi:hypothetical protein